MTGAAARADESEAAVATIAVEPSESGIRLTGRAVGLAAVEVDARLTIERVGAGGRTSTTQGGVFKLVKGQSVDVATVGLSMAAGDHLSARLVLAANGRPVASSTVETGLQQAQ
ncbi:curli-like amyloid fiber formation chaperone CsgH [Mangrovicella endophytica]|uniref:curli-like amyloid fiber formation chaperone CsgH n=1 Tax=Mangrovicella endophytica TaxID=2066697 RepID=UPI0013000945|nr:curli-like amyloid fiber formation chaperone CsgH [Mangrovicella endophytica]